MEGIQAAHAIRQRHPGIGVVVLSQHSDAAYALQLFRNGTEGLGYLLKSRVGELDELLYALREVAAGRSVIDPGVVERLVDYRARQAESSLRLLSVREVDVLRVMAEGKSNVAIAIALHLSESSVEKYVNTIFSKLPCMARRQKSAATRSSVALVWVANHAQIWGRAVELAYDRYLEAMKHRPASVLDSAVEFHLWMASMRMLWRIADRARTDLHLSTIDAAVAAFEQEVDTSELIALRDISQHADDYAVGLGRHPLKAYTADMDRWTPSTQAR